MVQETPYIAALVNDDHVKYIRRRNQDGFRHKYALSHTERRQLIRETSVHCLVLFEYYLRLASTENSPISDEEAAEYFDWTRTTAKRHRLALTHAGWYACEKTKLKNGRRIQVHYLGKDEVEAAGLRPKSEPKKKEPITTEKPEVTLFNLPGDVNHEE